jgi:hypothetical protein
MWFSSYCTIALVAAGVTAVLVMRWWRMPERLILAVLPLALVAVVGRLAQAVLNAANFDWTGARLAPLVGMRFGYPMYCGPGDGPVLNTIYAPISYLVYWPLRFLGDPAIDDAVATAIGLVCYFTPVAFFFIRFASPRAYRGYRLRVLGVTLFVLLSYTVPSLRMSLEGTTHDCPALGFALAACLVLYFDEARRWRSYFLSAAFTMMAIWSKQVMAPLLIALPLWTWSTRGSVALRRHLVALATMAVVISVPLLAMLGPRTLLFNILVLPAEHAWNGHFPSNFAVVGYQLYRDCFTLVAVLIIFLLASRVPQASRKRPEEISHAMPSPVALWFRHERWSLFLLVALMHLPTAFLGRLKVGGSVNSFSPVSYFLLFALLVGLCNAAANLRTSEGQLARSALVVAAVAFVLLTVPQLAYFFRDYHGFDASKEERVTTFLRRHPGEAYFPWHPLPHLLVEGKLYHFAYGLFDRELGGHGISDAHFQRFVPEHCRYVCFPAGRRNHRPPACLESFLKQFPRRVELAELPGFECYERND